MLFIPESDAAIVRRTLEGRPEAFEPLVFRYQRKAHALARAAGLGPEAADDVVQEAFLQAFRDLPSLRDPARFGAWFLSTAPRRRGAEFASEGNNSEVVRKSWDKTRICRKTFEPLKSTPFLRGAVLSIARNVSRKALERQPPVSRSLPVEPPSAAGAEPVEKRDFSDYLRQKVSELPQGIREAIFLYYYEGRKVREVARALSLTGWGVKRRLKTGRELLRGQLWRELEECLRDMLPSVREWRRKGGRLALLVLASLPLSFASRSGAALPPAGRRARWVLRAGTGGLAAARTTAMSLAALGLLLIVQGGASGISLHFAKQSGAKLEVVASVISKRPRAVDPAAALGQSRNEQPGTGSEISGDPAASAMTPDPEDVEYERSLGSILVRVVWEEDRAPAAGIHGMVIPWGSPALYIDEREFITGPDGTVLVDRVYQGGVSVMLDRGGRTDVNLTPGEGNEATVEVPRGLNVEGVVVDWSGFAVGRARVWISYGGHTNWGNEVSSRAMVDLGDLWLRFPGR